MEQESKKSASEYNVGASDYSRHAIQPYDIWKEYALNAWEADIIKRVLRSKGYSVEECRRNKKTDLQKIQHIVTYLLENFEEIY